VISFLIFDSARIYTIIALVKVKCEDDGDDGDDGVVVVNLNGHISAHYPL
jgi:hypothetical protein